MYTARVPIFNFKNVFTFDIQLKNGEYIFPEHLLCEIIQCRTKSCKRGRKISVNLKAPALFD